MTLPSLMGMVHLTALPGSPRFRGHFADTLDHAVSDGLALAEAGFEALMIENFGDTPFFPGTVPPVTVAALTRAVIAVGQSTGLPIGVNVLRNDGIAALGIAAATGARWIRVNILSGLMYTDQGPITGHAAEIARFRQSWCPQVQIMADVHVKHGSPPPGQTLEQAAIDTWERAGADALIVSGAGTGIAPDQEDGRRLRKVLSGAPIFVGSGASAGNLAELASFADGVIVGSALKREGRAENPVDVVAARAFREAARQVGW